MVFTNKMMSHVQVTYTGPAKASKSGPLDAAGYTVTIALEMSSVVLAYSGEMFSKKSLLEYIDIAFSRALIRVLALGVEANVQIAEARVMALTPTLVPSTAEPEPSAAEPEPSTNFPIVIVAAAAGGGLVLNVIIILAVVLRRRRNGGPRAPKTPKASWHCTIFPASSSPALPHA